MPYGRRYRRGYRRYSVENMQYAFNVAANSQVQQNGVVIGSTSVQGVRKVKHFRLTLATTLRQPVMWALIYVPENMDIKPMNVSAGDGVSMYEPNQNVIMAGLLSAASTNSQTFSTRLARRLNSGDSVVLCIRPLGVMETETKIIVQLSYAIAY